MPLNASAAYVWATYKFSAPHTLSLGQSYHLVLQSPASTVYQAFPIRKGSDYGYKNTTFFRGRLRAVPASRILGWLDAMGRNKSNRRGLAVLLCSIAQGAGEFSRSEFPMTSRTFCLIATVF